MTISATATMSGTITGSLVNLLTNGLAPDSVRMAFGTALNSITLSNGTAENNINYAWALKKFELDPAEELDIDLWDIGEDIGLGTGIGGLGDNAGFGVIVGVAIYVYPGEKAVLLEPGDTDPWNGLRVPVRSSTDQPGFFLWLSPSDSYDEATLAVDAGHIKLTADVAMGAQFDLVIIGRT